MWSQRDLTLKGKIVILKTLAIPHLLYACSVLHVSDAFIAKVDKAIQSFVWNHKPAKIKQTTMIADIKNGGMKMPHFKSMVKSHKIMWVKRILSQKSSRWKALAAKLAVVNNFELCCKYSTKYLHKSPTLFYKQILDFWYEFYSIEPNNKYVCKEIIWNNIFIQVNGRPISTHYGELLSCGIRTMEDIGDQSGKTLLKHQLDAKYGVNINIMFYNSIIHAIPSKWKKIMTDSARTETSAIDNDHQVIFLPEGPCCIKSPQSRDVYW